VCGGRFTNSSSPSRLPLSPPCARVLEEERTLFLVQRIDTNLLRILSERSTTKVIGGADKRETPVSEPTLIYHFYIHQFYHVPLKLSLFS